MCPGLKGVRCDCDFTATELGSDTYCLCDNSKLLNLSEPHFLP